MKEYNCESLKSWEQDVRWIEGNFFSQDWNRFSNKILHLFYYIFDQISNENLIVRPNSKIDSKCISNLQEVGSNCLEKSLSREILLHEIWNCFINSNQNIFKQAQSCCFFSNLLNYKGKVSSTWSCKGHDLNHLDM